jgi:hypothetical protein
MILFAFGLFAWSSCGSDAGKSGEDSTNAADTSQATPPAKIFLTDFAPSAEFADAKIESMNYKNGKFSYKISGTKYKLGEQTPDAPQKMCANSDKGQHIHLIVDNEPYVAQYVPEFEHQLPDGEHTILSFLSRSYHESIKTKQASVCKKVLVEKGSFTKTHDVKEPMLFYSRPKGNYTGKAETKMVMLDFYLVNCDLSADGYKLKILVNGQKEFVVDKWLPYYIEGLPMGDNKIQLTLVDKDGNTVDTPLNPVERVFTLIADPAE